MRFSLKYLLLIKIYDSRDLKEILTKLMTLQFIFIFARMNNIIEDFQNEIVVTFFSIARFCFSNFFTLIDYKIPIDINHLFRMQEKIFFQWFRQLFIENQQCLFSREEEMTNVCLYIFNLQLGWIMAQRWQKRLLPKLKSSAKELESFFFSWICNETVQSVRVTFILFYC